MPSNDRPPASQSNVVPRGCVIFTVLLIIGIGIAGILAVRYFKSAFEVPPELARFEHEDSVRSIVRNKAVVPAGTQFDGEWIAFYLDGVTASGRPLLDVRDVLDSMHRAGMARGDTGITPLLTSPRFYHAIALVEPETKRALVDFLNARNRSFDEYQWAKDHVIAATDITRESADSALAALIGPFAGGGTGTRLAFAGNDTEKFFERVDSIRRSGAISNQMRRDAMQSRSALLLSGLGSLFGLDTEFDAVSDEE